MAYQFPTQSFAKATPYRGVAYYNDLYETHRPAGYDAQQSAGNLLGYGDMFALGATPVVLNNLERTADPFLDYLDTLDQGYKNLNSYNAYSNSVQLAHPEYGAERMAYNASPGTLMGTALDLGISAINPYFGIARFANNLTSSDENPGGSIPILSHLQDGINYVQDSINNTEFAKGIRTGVQNAVNPIYEHLIDTRVGRPLYETASLPMEFVESGGNLFRETGEFIDRTIFGGYIPGLANDDDPLTQEWNNPFENFTRALEGVPGSYRTKREVDADDFYNTLNSVEQNFINNIVDKGNDYVDIVHGYDADRLAVVNEYYDDEQRAREVAILDNSDYLSSVITDPEAWVIDPTGYFEERNPGPLAENEIKFDTEGLKIQDELAPSFQKTLIATLGEEETKHIMGKDFMDLDVLRWFDEGTNFDQAYDFENRIRPMYYDSNDYEFLNSQFTFTDGELKTLSMSEGFNVDEVKSALDWQEEQGRKEFKDKFNDMYTIADSEMTQATLDELNTMKAQANQFDENLSSDITLLNNRVQGVVNQREATRISSIDFKNVTQGELSKLNDIARSFDSSNPSLAKQYDDAYFNIQQNKVNYQAQQDALQQERLRQLAIEASATRASQAQASRDAQLTAQIARANANTNHYNHATRTHGNRYA